MTWGVILDVEVSDVEGVFFNELATGLHDITHEDGEHAVGFEQVFLTQIHAQHATLGGVHGGFEELLGVHFTQAFEALNLDAAFADAEDGVEDARYIEHGVADGFGPLTLNDLEEGLVLAAEVVDVQAEFIELAEEFLHGAGFVDFDKLGAGGGAGVAVFVKGASKDTEVGMLASEFAELLVVDEVVEVLFVSGANTQEILWEAASDRVARLKVGLEVTALAADVIGEAGEWGEKLKDLLELAVVEGGAVGSVLQGDFIRPEFEKDAVQVGVVLDVFFTLFAGDFVKRWLGDVEVAALHQFRHVTAKEGEQQGADVAAIHVGVGHDDDLVVAGFANVKAAFVGTITDAGADGGDHGLDFFVLQGFVEAGFFYIDELST